MSDIFLSYSREDRAVVAPLARALEHEGFSVWWDPELLIGHSYATSIRSELAEARAVIAVWTSQSVHSEWVQEEATHGKRRGVLFPVRLEAVDPPIGFTMVEAADLSDWVEGNASHPEWSRLLEQLRARLSGPGDATAPDEMRLAPVQRGSRLDVSTLLRSRTVITALGAIALMAIVIGWLRNGSDAIADVSDEGTPTATSTSSPTTSPNPPEPRDVPAPTLAAGANSTMATARPLALGVAEPGEIFTTDDTRFYLVGNTLKIRDLALVRFENESTTLRPWFKVFNAAKSEIAQAYDGSPGATVEHVLTLDPGKTIYLQVLSSQSVGKYKISVTPQRAYDGHEPNEDLLTPRAAKVGEDISGGIMDKADHDWFRFSGGTGTLVKVTLENLSTTLTPYVKVYNGNKSQVAERFDGTPGANLSFEADLRQPGDFYVEVAPYASTGNYRLRLD
jgi:hypothetical protein